MTMHELAYTKGIRLVNYGRELEEEISRLQEVIDKVPVLIEHYPSRWLAIKLLEEDKEIIPKIKAVDEGEEILTQARKSIKHLSNVYGADAETIIADRRYGFISGLVKEVVQRPAVDRITLSDRIDKVITNRIIGIPIFLVAMWFVFQMTAGVSGAYLDWVDGVIGGPITRWVVAILNAIGLGGTWFESLMVDGIIAGVGGVLVFVPVLLFLYFFLALLEDSGYMARAAFVMDRLMHTFGLR
ncbi:MAG: nucleoside recognition domain-containing protein [Candidatus Humimicrobiia bacterium]